jgi:hypothetical protein
MDNEMGMSAESSALQPLNCAVAKVLKKSCRENPPNQTNFLEQVVGQHFFPSRPDIQSISAKSCSRKSTPTSRTISLRIQGIHHGCSQ